MGEALQSRAVLHGLLCFFEEHFRKRRRKHLGYSHSLRSKRIQSWTLLSRSYSHFGNECCVGATLWPRTPLRKKSSPGDEWYCRRMAVFYHLQLYFGQPAQFRRSGGYFGQWMEHASKSQRKSQSFKPDCGEVV